MRGVLLPICAKTSVGSKIRRKRGKTGKNDHRLKLTNRKQESSSRGKVEKIIVPYDRGGSQTGRQQKINRKLPLVRKIPVSVRGGRNHRAIAPLTVVGVSGRSRERNC